MVVIIVIDITLSIDFSEGHTYEGLFNDVKFRLECKYSGSKLICSNQAELICMFRRCGYVDI